MGSQRKVNRFLPTKLSYIKMVLSLERFWTSATSTPRLGVQTCWYMGSLSAASHQRDISHKVAGATTVYLQAVSTVLFKETIHEGVAYQSNASTEGIQTSRQCWRMGGCHLVADGQTRVSAFSCAQKNFWNVSEEKKRRVSDEKIRKMAKLPPVFVLVMARRLQLAARFSRRAPPALFAHLERDRSPWKTAGVVGSLPTARLHAGEAGNIATSSC